MVDWNKYPLVKLFIPFLLGIAAGYVSTVEMGWNIPDKWIFAAVSLCVCTLAILHSRLQPPNIRAAEMGLFSGTAILTFFLVGLFLSVSSYRQALTTYGPSYHYVIYRQNKLQDKRALAWQERLHRQFSSGFWSQHPEEGAVVEAMTIGRKERLTAPLRAAFSGAGIGHLLAISGYHIGILFLLFHWLNRRLAPSLTWRRLATLGFILALWLYALLTGMSPSIVRAVLMCSLITTGKLLQREVLLINACAFAAMIILAADPLFAGHVGFQLSFCCMAGIALTERFLPKGLILGGLTVSAVCTAVTFPLVAYHFGSLPLLGVFSNMGLLLLAPVIIVLSGLWWLAEALGQLGDWTGPLLLTPQLLIGQLLQQTTALLIAMARTIAQLPVATVHYRPSLAEVLCCYATLLSAIGLLYQRNGRNVIVFQLMVMGALLAAILRKTTH